MTSVRPLFPLFRLAASQTQRTLIYLLGKLQLDMTSLRTVLKQVFVRARLFDHLRVHRISPGVFVLPVIVVRNGSCEKRLFARLSFRAGIGGRGAREFVESERER